jgi:intein-encoded DNA endonuclease-like protein
LKLSVGETYISTDFNNSEWIFVVISKDDHVSTVMLLKDLISLKAGSLFKLGHSWELSRTAKKLG